MRQSQLFSKTRKEAPKDEVSKNAQLLLRAGYIHKELAGVYSYLPLGERVLEKIVAVIRREMLGLGANEVHLTALQDKAVWEKSGRWDDQVMDVWFKTELKNGTQLGLAPTHEEPLTRLMKEHIHSYRDLPRAVFQFQTKFRNETRAKSGIMRGREFLMKDLYSFSPDETTHAAFYERVKQSYRNIFNALGIGAQTFLTHASGGSFSKFSHEFQTVCEAGEDTIYIQKNGEAVNDEVLSDKDDKSNAQKAIEVGNIFNLGTRYADALSLTYLDKEGKPQPVVMGSYGIGPSRIMGAIVETLSDEKGIVWPEAVAPFRVHLIEVVSKDAQAHEAAERIYCELTNAGVEVLYDDRDARAGEKFADADLIGIPWRVIVSEKTLAVGGVELKKRNEEEAKIISEKELLFRLKVAV